MPAQGGSKHLLLQHGSGTGDLGALDEEGYLHFRGMTKPIVNLNGNKVDPIEVREVTLEHPSVATVELSAERTRHTDGFSAEMRICARVMPKPRVKLAESEVRAFCAERLASYKIPQVIVVDDSATDTLEKERGA